MDNQKWFHFDTQFRSLRNDFRSFLKKSGIEFEISEGCAGFHFEILLNADQKNAVEKWLEQNTFTNLWATDHTATKAPKRVGGKLDEYSFG